MSRHVVHIINNLPVGGAERFLVLLSQAQQSLGLRVRVLTLAEPNPLADELSARRVPYSSMGRRHLNDPRLVFDLWRALRTLRPDVVHTHLFYADTFGRLAARAAGVPAIVSTEHSTERGALSRRRRTAMRFTARFTPRIVAVSEAVRSATAVRLGVPAAGIAVIPNGIDLETWARAEPLSHAALDVEDDAILVGCVGRLDDMKGHDVLLEAVARLRHPTLRLLVVGEGPQRAALEARTRALDVGAAVRFLGWRRDVPRLLRTLQIFAMPSRFEGHSMALLEAMAAGCACVVSDIPELVGTLGDAGMRAATGDAEALAAALAALARDVELRRRLGREAQRAAQRFTIVASAQRYVALYEEILQDTATSGAAH